MTIRLTRRTIIALCLLLALAAWDTGAARAGQIVYPAGNGIWIMNDDGSAKRQLVDATQVTGMESLGDPSIQPNGTRVAFTGRWNQASVEQNRFTPPAPGFCGGYCEGIYQLDNGTVARMSPAPFSCAAQPCESQEIDPSVGRDGSVAYLYQATVSQPGNGRWIPVDAESGLHARAAVGAAPSTWPTACDGMSPSGSTITDASVLALNPNAPTQIAYGNCTTTSDDGGSCPVPYSTGYETIGSGATAGSAADDVLWHTDSDPTAQCAQNAGTYIGDLSFLDASHIVEVHGGSSGAGIYTYSASPNASATERLAIPAGWQLYAVRYIGNGRIGFTAGPSSSQVSLYAMSATCTPASCDVAAGRGVTNLTGSQNVAVDYVLATANFAYTSSSSSVAALTTPGPGPSPGPTPGPAPGPTPHPAPGCTLKDHTPRCQVQLSVRPVATIQHLARLTSHGLTIIAHCQGPCRIVASLQLLGTNVGTVSGRLTHAGTLRLTVHLKRGIPGFLRRHLKGKPHMLVVVFASNSPSQFPMSRSHVLQIRR